MISKVLDKNRKHIKGYLIDDLFIKYSYVKFFTKGIIKADKLCIGTSKGKGVVIDNIFYKDIFSRINCSNYKIVLNILLINNIELNDIIFISCKSCDLGVENLSSFWTLISSIRDNKFYYYACIDVNNLSVVGYLFTQNNLYNSDCLHISMLEIIEKDCGFGQKVVNSLSSLDKVLTGTSLVSTKKFWGSLGAVFSNDNWFTIY